MDVSPALDPEFFPKSLELSLPEEIIVQLERISARTGLSVDEVATHLLDRALQDSDHLVP